MPKQRRYCPSCDRMVLAECAGTSHVLHLLLTLLTAGLWLPVWFVIANGFFFSRPYLCSACGGSTSQGKPAGSLAGCIMIAALAVAAVAVVLFVTASK